MVVYGKRLGAKDRIAINMLIRAVCVDEHFCRALSDSWNKKKTMLLCDFAAAMSTVAVLVLIKTGNLEVWRLYAINAPGGLMNTEQPAAEVAATMLIPKEHYQRTSSLRSLSQSLNSILTPVIATALFTLVGIDTVIAIDLCTFAVAFLVLLLLIHIPEPKKSETVKESLWVSASNGLSWLKHNPLILNLILFLACINLIASMYDAALPAMIISKSGDTALGIVNTCVGIATLVGSIFAILLPAPKNRILAICVSLLISMGTENFFLAFGNSTLLWSIGAVLGWIVIPFMNTNMDVIFRQTIPSEMQGRVFSCHNSLQFFTIPVELFLGGFLVDEVFEPFMSEVNADNLAAVIFGTGKGSGAALLFFCIGIARVAVCLIFGFILKAFNRNDKNQ